MVWQEAFPPTDGPVFDAEGERERRLAAQARAGADWALTALIARYQPTVVRYLTRLSGNQAQARRLAERIFQRMERRLHGPHGADNLRLWLLRACTEAGLDALRRPQNTSSPRLGTSGVAGLLTEESGKDSSGFLQSGLRRLRQATGGASRQVRPLVWSGDTAATRPTPPLAETASPPDATDAHIDETLDRLDPRDALRHRLVRVTLAELPYGDAQCLALHLVAGLNQAEVAKALGITNSAARKRMVHGLALFADRYTQAVQSLGLPVELGFGDALPRPQVEPEPVAEPAPVVVSSQASDDDKRAPGEDRLIEVNPLADRGRDVLSGVSYLSEDSGEIVTITSQPETHHEAPYDQAETTVSARHPVAVALEDEPEEQRPTLIAEHDSAPVSGGLITRVASDAILGPIVDALPVTPAGPEAPGVMGLIGPRSVPLAYELSSNTTHEASGVTMNWLDDSGLMTPLSFEAVAIASGVFPVATESAPLGFEAVALSSEPHVGADTTDSDATVTFELAQTMADERPNFEPAQPEPLIEEPLVLEAEPAPLPAVTVPVLTEAPDEEAEGDASGANPPTRDAADETEPDERVEAPAYAPRSTPGITRSLEDVWDELPDGSDH